MYINAHAHVYRYRYVINSVSYSVTSTVMVKTQWDLDDHLFRACAAVVLFVSPYILW